MDFDYWKARGVFFKDTEQEIDEFLATHYPSFSLASILEELEQAASKWGFEWGMRHVYTLTSGNLFIHYQYDDMEKSEEEGSLVVRRILKQPDASGKRASHEQLYIPNGMQNQTASRDLLRPFYKQYIAADIDYIDAFASEEGGGYALAKYGFSAIEPKEVFTILDEAIERGIPAASIDILRNQAVEFYDTRPVGTPFPIWQWSKTPFAKALLRGTRWHAVLNFHDRLQAQTFKAYLYPESKIFPLL
ncbi:hypothetical protein GO988_23515 [Hymenobacter sp. HMF4947]|uniref:Uncharacterized protein n=1 Tax=Hymenobacter ginkgonis TaxID=2682976 RepID=A0A7K1TLS1_9BACT|nr:hypothetical protein [Hymenobacter ginkgonis]MVN79312.1 hypothetical protein [Hymenobacter ginkgonis]